MNIFCKVINKEIKEEIPENGEPKKMENSISDQDLQRLYAVEFKSQSYSSFYNTTMEKDKSILTLSVAGIGFLITLLKLSDSLGYHDMAFFSMNLAQTPIITKTKNHIQLSDFANKSATYEC